MRDYVQSVHNPYGSGPSQPGFLGARLTRPKHYKNKLKSKNKGPSKEIATKVANPPPGKGLATKGKKAQEPVKKPYRFRPGTRALQSGYRLVMLIFNAILYPGSVKSGNFRKAQNY